MDQELLDGIRQVVREEISGVKGDKTSLKDDLSSLKKDVAEMKRLLNKNNHLLRVLRIETDTNKTRMDIVSNKIDRLIDNQKRQNELRDKLKNNHHHQLVIQTGEPIINN
ncbi:MAG: hypothetical protein ACLFUK_09960 [Halanaerobium sp.]